MQSRAETLWTMLNCLEREMRHSEAHGHPEDAMLMENALLVRLMLLVLVVVE